MALSENIRRFDGKHVEMYWIKNFAWKGLVHLF